MDLKEFVKETITSIAEAAVELQGELADRCVVLNPPRMPVHATAPLDVYDPNSERSPYRQIEKINFDVAVTASEESAAKGGGGIKVAVLNAGGDVSKSTTSERVSRVAFTIAIALPASGEEVGIRMRADQKAEKNRQAAANHKPPPVL